MKKILPIVISVAVLGLIGVATITMLVANNSAQAQSRVQNQTLSEEALMERQMAEEQKRIEDEMEAEMRQTQQEDEIRMQAELKAQERIMTQEQEQLMTQEQTQTGNQEQNRSQVANAVQAMLEIADRNGGIGEQVRLVAQAQNDDQDKLNKGLEKIKNRGNALRFILGPDYQEIKDARKLLQQNRERVMELEQTANQLQNEGDAQQLIQQLQVLQANIDEMENALSAEEKGFSLFGWLAKLFVK